MITIKNDKGEICDYRPYIDVDISEEIENIQKIMEYYHQKFIKNTGIPRYRLLIDLGSSEGDIATKTVWCGNKIVDSKRIKEYEKDS